MGAGVKTAHIVLVVVAILVLVISPAYYLSSQYFSAEKENDPRHSVSDITSFNATPTNEPPTIDGILSPGEWNDAHFYNIDLGEKNRNISPMPLSVEIGFMYNSTHLFVAAAVNDDTFASFDALLLLFDNDNDVSHPSIDHVCFFAGNGTYNLEQDGHGYYIDSEGEIQFCRCGIHWYADQPNNATFEDGRGYIFEGAIRLDRIAPNSTDIRLNIAYRDMNRGEVVYMVDPLETERYPMFTFKTAGG